jgi:hypothetical protein
MYSVEELDQLRLDMAPEARDRMQQWFQERDIAEWEDLIEFWKGSPNLVPHIPLLTALPPHIALHLVGTICASFAVGVQFGYEIRQRQEIQHG